MNFLAVGEQRSHIPNIELCGEAASDTVQIPEPGTFRNCRDGKGEQ